MSSGLQSTEMPAGLLKIAADVQDEMDSSGGLAAVNCEAAAAIGQNDGVVGSGLAGAVVDGRCSGNWSCRWQRAPTILGLSSA